MHEIDYNRAALMLEALRLVDTKIRMIEDGKMQQYAEDSITGADRKNTIDALLKELKVKKELITSL
jgi:hypothetical protein